MIDIVIILVLLLEAFIFYWSGYDDCYIDYLKGKLDTDEPLIKLRGDRDE